jgi:hypothetical protein
LRVNFGSGIKSSDDGAFFGGTYDYTIKQKRPTVVRYIKKRKIT